MLPRCDLKRETVLSLEALTSNRELRRWRSSCVPFVMDVFDVHESHPLFPSWEHLAALCSSFIVVAFVRQYTAHEHEQCSASSSS